MGNEVDGTIERHAVAELQAIGGSRKRHSILARDRSPNGSGELRSWFNQTETPNRSRGSGNGAFDLISKHKQMVLHPGTISAAIAYIH
jgi:hypothetical protein